MRMARSSIDAGWSVSRDGIGTLAQGVLDGQGRRAGERGERLFVVRVESSAALVQDLEDADDDPILGPHRDREHVACLEPGATVDVWVEARVGVGIGEINTLARAGHGPGDADSERDADLARA